jgi:hypothetical protein
VNHDQLPQAPAPPALEVPRFLRLLLALEDPLPDPDTEVGREARAFFEQSWADARDGLLARTGRLSIVPASLPAPRLFHWTIERPFKRWKQGGGVELAPGPIRGTIHYRGDALVAPPDEPTILVRVDPDLGFVHPNADPVTSLICHGLSGLLPLEPLALHVHGIVAYQNMGLASALSRAAAEYFLRDPRAMDGLEPVEPLF